MSLTLASMFLWVLWAMGALAGLNLPGLARAADLDELKGQVSNVRAAMIAEKIDAVTTSLCMESYDARLLEYRRELQVEYRQVTGHEHTSPPCEILLKLRR